MSESKVPRQEEIVLATVQGKEVTSLPEDLYVPPNSLKIFLDTFAGPLDLLLYLIRKQNRDSVKDLNAAIAKFEKSANDELKSLRKQGSKAKPVKIKRYKS